MVDGAGNIVLEERTKLFSIRENPTFNKMNTISKLLIDLREFVLRHDHTGTLGTTFALDGDGSGHLKGVHQLGALRIKSDRIGIGKEPDAGVELDILGDIHASGNITADGHITLGDTDTDNITFNADINSNILPNTINLNIGSPTKQWNDIYIDGIANIDSLIADTADINGGTIDNIVIGNDIPLTGKFTTIVGDLTGDVTGNCSGSSGSCTGNAVTADKWSTVRTITMTGDVTSDAVNIDGTGNITITNTVVGNNSHTHDDRYYTETEINIWRNSVSQAEMGFVHGITSDIQDQLDSKGTSSLTLGTGSGDAYRGDYGNAAYNHKSSSGTDHTYINQSVTTTSQVSFDHMTADEVFCTSRLRIPTGEPVLPQNGDIWLIA